MSTLAHVFEEAGLATVVLASMRDVAERMAPPRALFGDFPLGRPLGHPLDIDFQRGVLDQAFATLTATSGPVLVDHPVVIVADEQPLACVLPARFDPDVAPAVDEARGLRKAYNRSFEKRGTSVGRSFDADGVPDALAAFVAIAKGADWTEAGIPGKNSIAAAHDIRSYYEEAALELVEGSPPGGRQAEAWYFERTEAGKTMLAARKAMSDQGAPFPFWFYMAPGHR
ncbi:MAG: hypothetical protein V3V01_05415 [Acidimicrobiales bacterium]